MDRLVECRERLDALAASGVKADQALPLADGGNHKLLPHASAGHTTLALLRGWCEAKAAKVQLLRTYLAVKEAAKTLKELGRGRELPERLRSVLAQAALTQRVCAREVARALAAKNDAGLAFARPDVKLGEAQDKVCQPLAAKVAERRAALPHGEVKLAGERAKIFEAEGLHAEEVFGGGKMPLKTMDDFKYASVWYVVLPDLDDRGAPAWILRGHRWDGDKLLETTETRGAGHEPPDEAFR